MSDVFKLKFAEEPHYDKLKHHLISILLNKNKIPDTLFDWSLFKVQSKLTPGTTPGLKNKNSLTNKAKGVINEFEIEIGEDKITPQIERFESLNQEMNRV